MYKDLVNSVTDAEFTDIVENSSSVNEIAVKLGFKGGPGLGSRTKINTRIIKLNLKLGSSLNLLSNDERDIPRTEIDISSKNKGDLSELAVQLELLENNIRVCRTISDSYPYDLIMDYDGKLYKIQVKTGTLKPDGSIHSGLCTSHIGKNKSWVRGFYSTEDVDIFAVHSIEYKTNCYFFNKGNMTAISFMPEDFKRQYNTNVIERFSLQRLLEDIRINSNK